jgi:hypothetical protein
MGAVHRKALPGFQDSLGHQLRGRCPFAFCHNSVVFAAGLTSLLAKALRNFMPLAKHIAQAKLNRPPEKLITGITAGNAKLDAIG